VIEAGARNAGSTACPGNRDVHFSGVMRRVIAGNNFLTGILGNFRKIRTKPLNSRILHVIFNRATLS
jgi:hypothetical protein